MTKQSVGRSTVAPRGGRMGRRTGRGGGGTRKPAGRVGGRTSEPDGQGGYHSVKVNGGVDEVPDFSMFIAQNVNVNNGRGGCSYKEFMACNLKDHDGKGGMIVYTRWVEKMESVLDMSGCGDNQKVKYTVGSFIERSSLQTIRCKSWKLSLVSCHGRAGHAAYTDRFHKLARIVPHLVTPKNKRVERYIYGLAPQIRAMVAETEPTTIQSAVLKAGMDGKARDDNKRSRTGRAFATITNPARREYTGAAPKCANCNYHHPPESPCRSCINCNRFGHFARDCWVVPRMVNPMNSRNPTIAREMCFECGSTDHYKAACPRLNQAPGKCGNRPNQALAIDGGQGYGNNGNQARGRAFMLGAEEDLQDPNIVTGTRPRLFAMRR
ncbi:putative reverse transcriptase domain-containing protein [Tanacetum coccineum]